MKKFFGFGKSKSSSSGAGNNRESARLSAASAQQLDSIKTDMQSYKGQKYNPAEDDGITTESLFKVIDGDTGEAIDVRELLGVTEEEFRSNPELQQAIAHMNNIQPIDSTPKVVEEEKKEELVKGNPDQKARHFKYFEALDTLPVSAVGVGATTDTTAEHLIELNAEGGTNEVIAWEDWWTIKEETNLQLFEAIGNRDANQVLLLLDEKMSNRPVMADINAKDERNQTPLHSSIFSGDLNITKLLIERFAEINAVDDDGKTSLHLACMLGNLSMVKLLLSKPVCVVDIQDFKGDTPLHLSCSSLNDPIIRHLVAEARTNLHIQNKEGKTPKDLLKQKAKQAGQLSRFSELIEAMEGQEGDAGLTDPQDLGRKQIAIHDADDNPAGSAQTGKGKVCLDDFEVIEPLGKGSFGSVFLVSKKGESPTKHYAMKILEKDKVLSQNLVRYARTERNVLSLASHQFIVGLNFAFQSASRLYLIMDYAPGGDMGMALANHRRFPVELARVYAAEIVLALEYLHKQNIIFRDLKPDNVVFDETGHAMLTDFGLSKTGVGSADVSQSFCGSVAYLAPEMLRRSGHSRTIDWYLLGVLIYEMLVGVPPYFNTSKSKLFDNIQHGPLKIPHTMPHDARQIILLLLNRNPQKRLGATNDAEEVKAHEFFANIDWNEVAEKKCEVYAPNIRNIKHDAKSLRQFLQQEKESKDRFADFEKTNLRGPGGATRAQVDNWSFVRPADQRPTQ